jgi:hypothetical protein
MAVYAQTTTLDYPKPGQLGNLPVGVISGTCNLTNYNSTLAEITTITKAFLPGGKLRVVPNGISSGGFIMKWDATGKAFRAYSTVGAAVTPSGGSITASAPTITTATGNPATAPVGVVTGALAQTAGATGITGVQAPTITDTRTFTAAAGALAESSNDVNVGTFDFVAVGQLG